MFCTATPADSDLNNRDDTQSDDVDDPGLADDPQPLDFVLNSDQSSGKLLDPRFNLQNDPVSSFQGVHSDSESGDQGRTHRHNLINTSSNFFNFHFEFSRQYRFSVCFV